MTVSSENVCMWHVNYFRVFYTSHKNTEVFLSPEHLNCYRVIMLHFKIINRAAVLWYRKTLLLLLLLLASMLLATMRNHVRVLWIYVLVRRELRLSFIRESARCSGLNWRQTASASPASRSVSSSTHHLVTGGRQPFVKRDLCFKSVRLSAGP